MGVVGLQQKTTLWIPESMLVRKKKKTHKEGPLGGTSCTSFLLEKQTNFLLGPWASLIAKPKVELKSKIIYLYWHEIKNPFRYRFFFLN